MEKWIRDLPQSRVAFPQSLTDRLKYWFWRMYTPLHAPLRDTSHYLGIVRHEGRQDFLLGTLDPEHPVREFVSFLVAQGFENHFIAWKDTGELVSLRRTVGFKYQYHMRIFIDGEVRCHFEYTPECHPVLHLLEIGMEDRLEEFRHIVQNWLLPTRNA